MQDAAVWKPAHNVISARARSARVMDAKPTRLDEFQRLEIRRRRPLGDISNQPKRAKKDPSSRRPRDAEKARALNFRDKTPGAKQKLPDVRQLSTAFETPVLDGQDSVFDVRKSLLFSEKRPLEVSLRSLLLQLVPYNAVVSRSNAEIRSHCDRARFKSKWKGDVLVVVKVSALSPLLTAVTVGLGEAFLLANPERRAILTGSHLVLGLSTETDPKMYVQWEVRSPELVSGFAWIDQNE